MPSLLAITPELREYVAQLIAQQNFPYVWPTEANRYSGKGLPGCLYPNGRDCSGTVTYALFKAGWRDERAVTNTGVMWSRWKPCTREEALPGDLVLYSNRITGKIEHVMTLMDDGRVYGADGAGSNCPDPNTAARLDAKVRYRSGIDYRAVVSGFRRNPLRR